MRHIVQTVAIVSALLVSAHAPTFDALWRIAGRARAPHKNATGTASALWQTGVGAVGS